MFARNLISALADTISRPNIRMVDSFGKGRVFVAGGECYSIEDARAMNAHKREDAAHIHAPAGGQVGATSMSMHNPHR